MTLMTMMFPKSSTPAEPAGQAAGNGAASGDQIDPSFDANGDPAVEDPAVELSFEDAIRRLGHIVEQLERGDLPLEVSLRLFEEGIGLARVSQRRLDRAERRIEELLGVDADGQPVTRPFEAKLDGG
jgi:exodeoxyribonuclease VII small subunit